MTCPEQSCKLTSKTNTLTIILLFSSLIPIACNTIFHNVLLHSTVHVFQLQGLKLHVNVHSRLFSNYTKFCCCHCFFLQKISVIRKPFLVHAIFFTTKIFSRVTKLLESLEAYTKFFGSSYSSSMTRYSSLNYDIFGCMKTFQFLRCGQGYKKEKLGTTKFPNFLQMPNFIFCCHSANRTLVL